MNEDAKDLLYLIKAEINIYNRNCEEGMELTPEDIIEYYKASNKLTDITLKNIFECL